MSNLIEIPGMRGKIEITFDITRGDVKIDAGGLDLRSVVQVLLMAVQGTVAQWIQIDQGIIGKGAKQNGSEENGTEETNDDDDDRGDAAS